MPSQRRLLIVDGESDGDGPNVNLAQAKSAVGHLYGSIQRLEFKTPAQLIAALPQYKVDRVITAGHGGRDGPNARGQDDLGCSVTVSTDSITLQCQEQDQLTTKEVWSATIWHFDILNLINRLNRHRGSHPDVKFGVTKFTIDQIFVLLALAEDLSSKDPAIRFQYKSGEPTSKTDDLPDFARFCAALAGALDSPSVTNGKPYTPYFYVGSCYSAAAWGSLPPKTLEPASFISAVAQGSGIPTFGNVHGTSVGATLQNLALIEQAVDAEGDGSLPTPKNLLDHVQLAR
ncbi:MAG: hypothetical protein IPL79_15710 [Myxococcales bacterium]|nr:hypothetical protein [Myxococcales bacterium]